MCYRATLSSLSPRKNRNISSSSCFFSLQHPPTHLSLRLHPALIRPGSHAGKMTERGKREWRGRERGEKDVTAPQQVWRTGERESEGEKEREKKRESYSDDELLAMGGGRDICGIKRCWSLVKHALTCRSHFAHTHTHTLS